MKALLTMIMVAGITASFSLRSQELYIKHFGDPSHTPVIFLHGGPGYNSASFEMTAAEKLSQSGFFVISYDRRGEGRSADSAARFTFDESFGDILSIYERYGFDKAVLMGHSFGGVLATLFADKYPEKTEAIVLVSAPVSLQQSFRTIIGTVKDIYTAKGDSVNLAYMGMLEKMDTTSMLYASYCFAHAMRNGFYRPKDPGTEATGIYKEMSSHPSSKLTGEMTAKAPQGFWKNEKYTTLDLAPVLKKLKSGKMKIYGIYGKEDGLYSSAQVTELQEITGEHNLRYLDNCSHSVFIDCRSQFIAAINEWIP